MTDLILWRHAEAEDISATGRDADRALTKRGRKDAERMAQWLNKHLPADAIVLSSPAKRCQETVAALGEIRNIDIKNVEFLSVDSTVEKIASALALITDAKSILIVGHQPNLGFLIANILGMQESACVVKKGAVWWLRQRLAGAVKPAALETYLFTVQHPDYLI